MTYISYYYDQTPTQTLSDDPEGNLVALCLECSADHAADIAFAGNADDEAVCDVCGAGQADGDDDDAAWSEDFGTDDDGGES